MNAALAALIAAALFGASTPLIKQLVGDASPLAIAGLLYLGSGLGLGATRLMRDAGWKASGLGRAEWAWFGGAILSGGVIGPVLLVWGLRLTSAGTASLLLNLEAVLTAALAWLVFREHAARRIVLGMGLIVAGGVVLAWPSGERGSEAWLGPLTIAGACLCWAIDNNLTRKVAAADSLFIAGAKGLTAGAVNLGLALLLDQSLPPALTGGTVLLVGWLAYGLSLALFVRALRELGTSRTGAYFSVAPFFGAALSLVLPDDALPPGFWLAGALMGLGVWLHLTEHHAHEHLHGMVDHAHVHAHDEHHRHEHDFAWDGREPHDHAHRHEALRHSHAHFPDIHHRHDH